ncbi:hypothetical protein, partial [Kitasatospora sp. NPDC097643]|uniref:hypothetical protein n=1 Tax=Kitasatospora sp. NPDC097643 TaxID=3157230 RepID=UPI00331E94BC
WHAVEFSRNGHFLRTAFQRALRALRSFVFPAYQMFSAPFSGVSFIRFPELAGPLSATAFTLAHSGCYPKFTLTLVGGNANRPKLMGFGVRVGLAK